MAAICFGFLCHLQFANKKEFNIQLHTYYNYEKPKHVAAMIF